MSLTKVSYSMIEGASANVLDYGAVGDGVADDSAAIQAAITDLTASGGTLFFPNGTYKIESTVTLASNVSLIANTNAALTLDVAEVGLQIPASATNITISGFTISGTFSRAISSALSDTCTNIKIIGNTISGATLVGAGYTSGIFLLGASDCLVKENTLSGNGMGGIADFSADIAFYAPNATSTGSRNRVLDNTCKSTTVKYHITAFNIDNCLIDGNYCSGAQTSSANNDGYGIVVYDTASYTLPYTLTNFNTISNNTVTGTEGTGIYVVSTSNTTVTGNTVSYVATVQNDTTLPVGGIVINGGFSSQNTVVGNTVSSSGKDGIVSSANLTTTISGNTVTASAQHGIHLRGANQSITVTGNTVSGNTERGIYDDATAKTYITISGNTFNSNTESGIDINGMTQSVVSNNVSSSNNLFGVLNGGDFNSITNNVLFGNTSGAFSGVGTGNMLRGNKFSNGECQGVATLVAGTVTVGTVEIRSTDIVLTTRSSLGGTLGNLTVRSIVSGTSFVIDSSSATDTSSVYWEIVH
jgi:parallel beta-helix repeat protein